MAESTGRRAGTRLKTLVGVVAAAMVAGALAAPSAFANTAPVCPDATVTVAPGGSIGLSPSCTDSDGPNSLSYSVVSGPTHGTLSGATYTNNAGLPGDDSFTYRAYDGADFSNTATVTIHVGTEPPPPPPPPPGGVTGQTVNAAVSPDTQSPSSFGEASLAFSWDTTYSTPLPPKEVVIHFDDDIAFDPSGLATCDLSQIQNASTADATTACSAALVGSGTATIVTSGAPLSFVVTAFNAAPSGGNPQIYFHVRSDPLGLTVVLPGTIRPSTRGADFGSEIDITNWPNTPGLATGHFDLTFPQESVPGVHYAIARCGDADQTWNFAADLTFWDDSTQSATSSQSCHTGDPDTDLDGIADSVDTQPATSSNAFDDGTGTSGSITDRAGLPVAISNASNPSKGVHVSVGAGSGSATIDACGYTHLFAAGTEADLTCGSTILDVTQGEVKVVSPLTTITVPAGAQAEVSDNGDGTFDVQNTGDTNVTVTTGDVTSTVAPGTSATVLATYAFGGFFSPVGNPSVLNAVKAGQTVPVKFTLHGDQGLGVLASGYPKSQAIACDANAEVDGIESTLAAGSSGLTYDPGTGQYTYAWKTDKSWANSCRQLVVKLADGTKHVANFSFK